MKKTAILYWVFTGLLVPIFGIGSVLGLVDSKSSASVLKALGYPEYLSIFLCIARLLALGVIFIPKFPTLKEWAYAGLVFDVIGAIFSILMVHHSITEAIFPIIALLIVFSSYYYHKLKFKTT